MPVTVIAGALFTVNLDGTPATVQIKNGTIDRAINVINEKTLGPNTTPVATDYEDTVTVNGLYDGGDAGWFNAVWDASETLAAIAVVITDGQSPAVSWTGDLMPSALSNAFGAEASAESSATFTGRLVRTTGV
jgi:hypothetical protein